MANFNWLAALLGLSLFFSPLVQACDSRDKAALLSIKASFAKPSKFSSWNESADCCTWYGVSCDPFGAGHRVTTLSFYNNGGPLDGLFGRLPNALGDLPFLYSLSLGNHPDVYGAIPPAIGRLRSLSVLSLSHNSLSGYIPSFLCQLPKLTLLDLSHNKFRGCIPPELSTLPILQSLILEGNMLEGAIPAAFGNFNHSSPPNLFLAHNKLSGDIPTELGLPNWPIVDLSHNKLRGDARTLFGENKLTTFIDISFNRFAFDLSTACFPINMWKLDMSMNMITGSIPDQINQLRSLVHFNVSYNQLCGIIPAGSVMDKFDDSHFFRNKCLCRSKDYCL